MFTNSIDNKQAYTNNDGIDMIDLTDSIFGVKDSVVTCSFYKVRKNMEMRPDLMSIAAFGEDIYTEMIIKYSQIDNPFAIEEGDIIAVPTLNSIYDDVKDIYANKTGIDTYDLVKNYHKYIDKSKVPAKMGAEESTAYSDSVNNKSSNSLISSSDNTSTGNFSSESNAASETTGQPIEGNMANNGQSGIFLKNGRLYFGPNVSSKPNDVTDIEGNNIADSDLVDCARNDVTIGQFLNATLKNSLKK